MIKDLFGILVIVIVNVINRVGEYLVYKNCKCRNKLVDKLVEKCSEIIDQNKIIYNSILNDYENVQYTWYY